MTTWYSPDHEWISVEADVGTVGITIFATEKLGDVVFVELPDVARKVKRAEAMAVVESVKAASDVFAPVSGEVVEVNTSLVETPETVNADPEGAGWFVKLKLANTAELSGLMDKAGYDKFCATQ